MGRERKKKKKKKKLVLWWVEARISAQPCLSGLRARSCGGGYWIQMRPVSLLRPLSYRWKCSYQHGLSESDCRPIRLIDDFRCPCPPSPPRGTHWLMSGSQWYFHIDTSIDDGAPGTSHIDQLESDTFQTVWLMYLCIIGIIAGLDTRRWRHRRSEIPQWKNKSHQYSYNNNNYYNLLCYYNNLC